VGLQKFSAKTFSGEHNRLGQASILAEADSPVFFSRVVKVLLFGLFASLKKKKQKMLVVGTPGFQDRVHPCGVFA